MYKMLALKNAHPRDQEIEFREEGHVYTIRGDKYYKSCTTWLKSFFSKFDPDAVIEQMMNSPNWESSKYYGKTKQEIKQGWSENGKRAAEFGTSMHKVIEDFYNGAELPKDLCPELHSFIDFHLDHEHLTPFRTEMMIFDEEIRICGSVDMLFQNEDGTYSIYDWKFAKEIQTYSYGKKALFPLEHLNDCNTVHYTLQLNLYRVILERKYGYVIQDMHLIFMHRDLGKTYIKFPVAKIDMDPILSLRMKQIKS